MNAVDAVPAWAAVPVALLLVLGGGISLIGALGVMRLPTFYQRIHGPAVIVALGACCILSASMLYFTVLQQRPVIHELLIGSFVLMTAPVVAMLLTRASVYRDVESGTREPGGPGELYRPAEDRGHGGVEERPDFSSRAGPESLDRSVADLPKRPV